MGTSPVGARGSSGARGTCGPCGAWGIFGAWGTCETFGNCGTWMEQRGQRDVWYLWGIPATLVGPVGHVELVAPARFVVCVELWACVTCETCDMCGYCGSCGACEAYVAGGARRTCETRATWGACGICATCGPVVAGIMLTRARACGHGHGHLWARRDRKRTDTLTRPGEISLGLDRRSTDAMR